MRGVEDFLSHAEGMRPSPVNLNVRISFNPNLTTAWFTSVMAVINDITMLAIILAGATIVREREHGTVDHLLVMPLTPVEIAMSKVWANGLVIAVAVGHSVYLVLRLMLGIPVAGSIPFFMLGVVIYLFFATAIGIFLGTVARSMPQLGLLFMLVYLPMNMLSGGNTPLESMPPWLANFMQISPSTHFVAFAQAILYRGAGLGVAAVSRSCRHRRVVLWPRHPALPFHRCLPRGSINWWKPFSSHEGLSAVAQARSCLMAVEESKYCPVRTTCRIALVLLSGSPCASMRRFDRGQSMNDKAMVSSLRSQRGTTRCPHRRLPVAILMPP